MGLGVKIQVYFYNQFITDILHSQISIAIELVWNSQNNSAPFKNFYKKYNFPIVFVFMQLFFYLIDSIICLKLFNVFIFLQIFIEQKPLAGTKLSAGDTNKMAPFRIQ